MRCSPRPADWARFARAALVAALLACLTVLAPAARGDEILVGRAALEGADDGYTLSADFDFDLSTRLEDALSKGVPLYFLVEFELTRPRWYWLDERSVVASQSWRVSFHALTRTYRVSSGALTQSFPTLSEAMRTLSRVRGWTVIERGQVKPDTRYLAAVRMRLDTTQLPKPFQVSALANREWTLSSNWYRWEFTTPGAASRAPPVETPRPAAPEAPKPADAAPGASAEPPRPAPEGAR
jgi:hypothetical protein